MLQPAANISVEGQGYDVAGNFTAPPFNLPPQAASASQLRDDSVREVIDDQGVSRRLLNFHAQYLNEIIEVQLPDSLTVGEWSQTIRSRQPSLSPNAFPFLLVGHSLLLLPILGYTLSPRQTLDCGS